MSTINTVVNETCDVESLATSRQSLSLGIVRASGIIPKLCRRFPLHILNHMPQKNHVDLNEDIIHTGTTTTYYSDE